jgi:hypothetical protein
MYGSSHAYGFEHTLGIPAPAREANRGADPVSGMTARTRDPFHDSAPVVQFVGSLEAECQDAALLETITPDEQPDRARVFVQQVEGIRDSHLADHRELDHVAWADTVGARKER